MLTLVNAITTDYNDGFYIHNQTEIQCYDSLWGALVLREDSEQKLALLVGIKGGGDDDILARFQAETFCHLAYVDIRLAASYGRIIKEEILLQLLLATLHLKWR